MIAGFEEDFRLGLGTHHAVFQLFTIVHIFLAKQALLDSVRARIADGYVSARQE